MEDNKPGYKLRLTMEEKELFIKIEKLKKFKATDKFKILPMVEQELLNEQLKVMVQYHEILEDRISIQR